MTTIPELVKQWDNQCIICGHGFENYDCVSREHLTPVCKGGSLKDNIAPSHYICNHIRGSVSILEARKMIDDRERSMSPSEFKQWLNQSIPDVKKLVERFGREKTDEVRLTWHVEQKWPWWKFPKPSKAQLKKEREEKWLAKTAKRLAERMIVPVIVSIQLMGCTYDSTVPVDSKGLMVQCGDSGTNFIKYICDPLTPTCTDDQVWACSDNCVNDAADAAYCECHNRCITRLCKCFKGE